MLNCRYKKMVSLFIDDMLDEKKKKKFLQHLENCSECKRELDEIQQLISLFNILPEEDLPDEFTPVLHKKLVEVSENLNNGKFATLSSRKYIRVLSTAAACIVIAFAVRGALWWNGIFVPDKSESNIKTEEITNNGNEVTNKVKDSVLDRKGSLFNPHADSSVDLKAKKADEAVSERNIKSEDSRKTNEEQSELIKFSASLPKTSNEEVTDDRCDIAESNITAAKVDRAPVKGNLDPDLDFNSDTAGAYIRECEIIIKSRNPIVEISKLKTYAQIYDIVFIKASPDGILDLEENSTLGQNETEAPNVITLICKVNHTYYDQFIALLKTLYPQSSLSIRPLNIIEISDKYKELVNTIEEIEKRITDLEKENEDPEKANLIENLRQQVEQYQRELDGLEESSKYVKLTVTINSMS